MKSKILMMDDSPLVHQIYGETLKQAGYEVVSSTDSLDAINKAFVEQPDLILLDIHMPTINGYQVCRLLKDNAITKEIPIVIMTGSNSDDSVADPRKWSFQTGADGYMDKENGENLKDVVGTYLRKTPRDTSAKVAFKPMSDVEILTALSNLLDKQLYNDVTYLKELDNKKDAFVGNVSHELKSPLGIIKECMSLMNDGLLGPISDDQKENIEMCLGTINRLVRLIHDLLDVSQMQAGKLKLKVETFRMEELIDEAMRNFEIEGKKRSISITKEIKGELPPAEGDKDRLMQVFVNILSNSVKYTPDGKSVCLKMSREGDYIQIIFEDTGQGMKEKDLSKIFDKFERVTAEKQEGTGLGLPIARDIVDLHNGKIWVESVEGEGTQFFVQMPLKHITK